MVLQIPNFQTLVGIGGKFPVAAVYTELANEPSADFLLLSLETPARGTTPQKLLDIPTLQIIGDASK